MSFKIYTKTGDKGETGLFGGARVSKDDLRIEAYGTVDELNSFVGMLIDQTPEHIVRNNLGGIQEELFIIGSHLAKDPSKNDLPLPKFPANAVERLEAFMDDFDEKLTPLSNFILPGGHVTVSSAHICRTVCRRAERRIISLSASQEVAPWIIQYLNRLSDFFFMLARYLALELSVPERPWRPSQT